MSNFYDIAHSYFVVVSALKRFPKRFLYSFLKKPALKKFLKKAFLIFWKQNLLIGVFFLKDIFRTLAYLELEAYSELWYI